MAVKIEKFNNMDSLLINMVGGCDPGQSLEEIYGFIDASLEEFVREHKEELIAALDSDFYDLPEVPSFDSLYRTKLKPEVRTRVIQSGFGEEEIRLVLGYAHREFYRSVLPSVRSL